MSIPDVLRRAALWPVYDLPGTPPEHPFQLVSRERFTIGAFRELSFGMVYTHETVEEDRIDEVLIEARSLLVERGKERGAWFIPEATRPAGLEARLRERGLVPHDDPPFEPRFTAMLILEPPQAGPVDVEARLANTFEEYQAGSRVADNAFDLSEDDRRAMEAQDKVTWDLEASRRSAIRTFIAIVDGEIVGTAAAIYGANASYLVGGSVREDMRGRGIYRALVRARWDAASQNGTPAMTVSAGRMSRPILERLGFNTIGQADCLLDTLGRTTSTPGRAEAAR